MNTRAHVEWEQACAAYLRELFDESSCMLPPAVRLKRINRLAERVARATETKQHDQGRTDRSRA